ncbi:glycerate kinase [Spongiimicrobium sp. 3-5]|uniref:glycerate kinase n=1 Tax=Spongiimicrobium sp. 3-5 TaxID=3332596 RepID=UPI00397F030B
MKFVLAPDKFKGSLTGFQFCNAVEEGLKLVFKNSEVLKMPLADGGDGTMEVVKHYLKAKKITLTVKDPLFRPIAASYLYSEKDKTAYIEMAEASGLNLLKETEQNCMYTTSFGTGELIEDAMNRGARNILLGIGGSATNDGGIGMASALGFSFLDKHKETVKPIGAALGQIVKIDSSQVHPKLTGVTVKVACDVTNPLHGENGAAKIYAPQKGASQKEIEILDRGLKNYAQIIKEQFKVDVQKTAGAGAAGGMGAGALIFLNGTLASGIELIKKMAEFDKSIQDTDWVITGEGKLDHQTLSGKTMAGVLKSAIKFKIPVAALCGSVDISESVQESLGLTYVTSTVRGVSDWEEIKKSSYEDLRFAAFNFAKTLKNSQDS